MILRIEYVREKKPQLFVYSRERVEILEAEVLSAFMRVHRELYPSHSENKSATEEDILIGTDSSARLYFYQIEINSLDRWFKRIKSGVVLEKGVIQSENARKYLDKIVDILREDNKEAIFQEYSG